MAGAGLVSAAVGTRRFLPSSPMMRSALAAGLKSTPIRLPVSAVPSPAMGWITVAIAVSGSRISERPVLVTACRSPVVGPVGRKSMPTMDSPVPSALTVPTVSSMDGSVAEKRTNSASPRTPKTFRSASGAGPNGLGSLSLEHAAIAVTANIMALRTTALARPSDAGCCMDSTFFIMFSAMNGSG